MYKITLTLALTVFLFISCQEPEQEIRIYHNPIIAGYYPDPSICKVKDDYYLVNSSFAHYPGVPIFHSKDLVNWNQIGHILDRPSQLNLDGLGVSRGIFAPTIRYNEGSFFMITTSVDGIGNFVVTSDKPEGPWSDPVTLPDVWGIDPSIFFDDDGKSYVIYNGDAPDNNPLYNGHRAIWMREFDKDNLKTTSDKILLVNGGTDLSKKPIWIEGPHIYKHNGFYYLIAAEGGTGFNHSQVVFRSKEVKGPYIPWKGNPMITQKHLDPNRRFAVTNTGHADFIQTQNNEWWTVFLASRPYEKNLYNTGRETFLAPVNWTEDGWPYIEPYQEAVRMVDTAPNLQEFANNDFPKNGNFKLRDNFEKENLNLYWLFLRTVREKWHTIEGGKLKINVRPEAITERLNISMISRRQQHINCSAIAHLEFTPADTNEIAGITAFQNEEHFYLLGKTIINDKQMIGVFSFNKENNKVERMGVYPIDSKSQELKIEMEGSKCHFSFREEGNSEWTYILENADAKILSTDIAGGFVGTILGMYASSNGKPSDNIALFDWFEYIGNDPSFDL